MKPRRNSSNSIPEVNLVPLMDVLMSVLTFFIIISMNLSSQSILSVEAPSPGDIDGNIDKEDPVDPFVVGLNQDGELLISDVATTNSRLTMEIRQYLTEYPEGYVRLKADRRLDYGEITQALTQLRDMGSGRVSLAIE